MFRFPRTNLHELNLDWMLNRFKKMESLFKTWEDKIKGVVTSVNGATGDVIIPIPSPATINPKPLGVNPAIGVDPGFSRGDHVHPLPSASDIGAADKAETEWNLKISQCTKVRADYRISGSYPSGWAPGYFSGTVGNAISETTSNSYAKYFYRLSSVTYPNWVDSVKFIEVVPPSSYAVRIFEYDPFTGIVSKRIGEINTDTYPESAGKAVIIEFDRTKSYAICMGKGSFANVGTDTALIDTVEMYFYVSTVKKVNMPKIHNGTASTPFDYQFFTVNVPRPLAFGGEDVSSTTDEIECVLQLPTNYSMTGDPVPLVLMCHGASGYISKSERKWYNSNWVDLCNALSNAGFALFDVNALPSTYSTSQRGNCYGSPLSVNNAKAAYDYIVSHYNVMDKIFVHGTSMGGVLASAFVKAYPQICLAQSSFAGRDLAFYLEGIKNSTFTDTDDFALSYGYTSFAELTTDHFSHVTGLTPSLSIRKYVSGSTSLAPDRETDYNNWLAFYAELQEHARNDSIGDYTAFRSVPYKSWNSWVDSEASTKCEEILQKAYTAGGSSPYECVFYESGTHTQLSYGSIGTMRDQLISWFKRWLGGE